MGIRTKKRDKLVYDPTTFPPCASLSGYVYCSCGSNNVNVQSTRSPVVSHHAKCVDCGFEKTYYPGGKPE